MKLTAVTATAKGPADRFRGDVYVTPVSAPTDPSYLSAGVVHFTPGARTNWHVHPNGQTLRPTSYPDNVAGWLVKLIQTADTPTNVFPSMHIVGALGVAVALFKSEKLRKKAGLQIFSVLLCISICLATMFLKQHSAVDVMGAAVVFLVTYFFVYHGPASKLLTWLADVFLKHCQLDRLCVYREKHPVQKPKKA